MTGLNFCPGLNFREVWVPFLPLPPPPENHGIIEKRSLEVVLSSLSSQAGSPRTVCQGTVSRWLLSTSKEGYSTNSRQPVPVVSQLHHKGHRNLLCSSMYPLPLVLSQHYWKEPGSDFLCTLPLDIYTHWDPLTRLNTQYLSSYERCSSPFIIFRALYWTLSGMSMPLLYWQAPDWTQYSRCCLTSSEQRWPCNLTLFFFSPASLLMRPLFLVQWQAKWTQDSEV